MAQKCLKAFFTRRSLLLFIFGFPLYSLVFADDPPFAGETRIYNTIHIKSVKPEIDGVLDDACWLEGEWTGNYRQNMPAEGAQPTQKTEFKILFDDENIYVAILAYDNEPDKIDRQMTRRDERLGDIVGVNFDSYFDHRTGFEFNLTAAGCKLDLIMTNDGFDANWNPVWDGKVGKMDSGWIAEMEIPLSQLRYGKQETQVWGLHAWRWINRNRESDHWNLIPRDNAGLLYYFGELHGLNNLPKISRMEFMPYTLAKMEIYQKTGDDPYKDGFDPAAAIGLDGKFGLGSNFTLDYTINPDFGQVEADPSDLNLTAFETYYEEKRPFFIEGRNIFDYSFDDNQLFYSRRIGHIPMYYYEPDSNEYVNQPENTSILGALKLTGKTSKGLSVGIMESLTSREYSEISSPEGERKMVAEPLTNYFVGRVQKDINKSNTMIGGMFTSTLRDIDHNYLDHINKSSITGGVDFRHYLLNKSFYIDFKALVSQAQGSTSAITSLQKESSRYYQRPDAPHLKIDTTVTQLTGYGGILELVKGANGKWRYGIGTHWRSPGLELNDLGFQNKADEIWEGQMVGYVENIPKGIFRTYEISLGEINYWNFGGEYLYSAWELEGISLFKNKWGFNFDLNRQGKTLNTSLLRGGPGIYQHGYTEQDYEISSDVSRKFFLEMEYENSFSDDRITHHNEIALDLNWKVTTSMVLSSELTFNKSIDDLQFIEDENITSSGSYVMGRLTRKTDMITLRLSYALTPEFTIQYYGSPYISMGKFEAFKTLSDPDTEDPDRVFHTFNENEIKYDKSTGKYTVYDDTDPEPLYSFDNPDFNFREFRSNLVARWEYRPGSVLYLVWTHNRTSEENVTNNNIGYNYSSLFKEPARNVFLIKFSYWFSR